MSRKRTRRLTLVLLGSAGLMASGCGKDQAVPAPAEDRPAARLDEVSARRVVAAGTAATLSEGYLHAAAMLARGPGTGLAAPLDLARLAYITDQAVETYDVAANNAQVPHRDHGGGQHTPRQHYHYHHGPGIGWFLFGYMAARSFSGPSPYVPPRNYGPSPRPVNPSYGNRAGFPRTGSSVGGGGVAGGGSRSRSTGGGSVGRGGFGGSGGAHASGGGGS